MSTVHLLGILTYHPTDLLTLVVPNAVGGLIPSTLLLENTIILSINVDHREHSCSDIVLAYMFLSIPRGGSQMLEFGPSHPPARTRLPFMGGCWHSPRPGSDSASASPRRDELIEKLLGIWLVVTSSQNTT